MDIKHLEDMPAHLPSFSVMLAALSEPQKTALSKGERVFVWSKGHLPSVTPEGESVSFMLEEGVPIGTYRKAVRFGQDVEYTRKVDDKEPEAVLGSLEFAIAVTVVADMATTNPEIGDKDREKMQEDADDARAQSIEQYLADHDAVKEPESLLENIDFAIAMTAIADMAMAKPEVGSDEDRKKIQEVAAMARAASLKKMLADYDAANGK